MLGHRLRSHTSKKVFWTWLVAFTSTDESLNKVYVRHLEACLLAPGHAAKRWTVENTASPNKPPMSEAGIADAEWFLHEMLLIYPILGSNAFEVASARPWLTGLRRRLIERGVLVEDSGTLLFTPGYRFTT